MIDGGLNPPLSVNSLISTNVVATHTGVNGAWSSNPNNTSDLNWSIISQTNSNGVDVSTGQQPYFSLTNNNNATNQVQNNLLSIPPSEYTIVVQLQDAGGTGLSDTVTNVVNYAPTINLSQSLTVVHRQTNETMSDTYIAVVLEVTNFDLPGQADANGFYVYKGSFSNLTNNSSSGNITLDLTGANKAGTNCSSNWSYNTTKTSAITLWENCTIPQGTTLSTSFTSIQNASNFTFSIK